MDPILIWRSGEDARVCSRCGALDGCIEGDGWSMDGCSFGDVVGPPPLHLNCRCWIEALWPFQPDSSSGEDSSSSGDESSSSGEDSSSSGEDSSSGEEFSSSGEPSSSSSGGEPSSSDDSPWLSGIGW